MTAATSGYSTLAANLADPFLTDANQQPLLKELPQLLAEANVKVVRYQSVSTSDPMLRRVAQEAAESGAAMVQSQASLDALAQDDGFSDILIGGLALYVGEPTMVLNAAGSLLQKGDARQQERIKWASALNRSRAAQLMLPEAAKGYAGEARATGNLVSVDFDESFAGGPITTGSRW
ncbi:MAG: hypothetical protein ACKVU4_02770 [Phycisphaerales bacterium]